MMPRSSKTLASLYFLASFQLLTVPAPAQELNADCLECHVRKQEPGRALGIHEALSESVHAQVECADCHETIDMDDLDRQAANPHGEGPHTIACSMCHDDAADAYELHGRLEIGKDPDLPSCSSCHGSHDIRRVDDSRSRVHPRNLAGMCISCHTNLDLVKKHEPLYDAPVKLYESSVHGAGMKKGVSSAATCTDCHGADSNGGRPTGHRILAASNPEASINHFQISATCGRCHTSTEADFNEGIHGQLVARGDLASPVCTTCHGEHGIISPDDPASPVSAAHVATQTCAPCHESVVLNEKYGLPGGRLTSYIDSYHGLKSKAGSVKVANCASCHGGHRILPSTDPTSSIHPNNLQRTCGQCHPGISAEMAAVPIHATSTSLHTGWPEFFRKLYIVLIVVVVGGMIVHNGAHFFREMRIRRDRPFVIRFNANETAQHWVLMISFIVLVISGFALRFSEAWWVQWLFGWGDGRGFLLRGQIHRVSAIVLIASSIWHVFYLTSQRGRSVLRAIGLRRSDVRQIGENCLFFLGKRDKPPRFGMFSYMEKLEYWALVWGVGLMSVTGLLLWFDNYFTSRWSLPKDFLEVMLVIHYYEAWLATLAILVWHIYGTVFSPTVYPMNPTWLDGRMPAEMYHEEHPEGPHLKERTTRPRLAEEVENNDSHDSEPPNEAPRSDSRRNAQ